MTVEKLRKAIRNETGEGISLDQSIFYALGDGNDEKWQQAQKLVPQKWFSKRKREIETLAEEYRFDVRTFSLIMWIYERFGEAYAAL
ncbi:MAG TPA: hypothetical protein P5539_12310 [Mesotoga sp.]|nr:hypothetical protein [Mesotoga sp.]